MRKVTVVQDSDCHWYIIPSDMLDTFMALEDLMNSENVTISNDAEDRFIEMFSEYATGGDPNNIQLYAEI